MDYIALRTRARETHAELTAAVESYRDLAEAADQVAWFDYRPLPAGERAVLAYAHYEHCAARFQQTNIDALTPYRSMYADPLADRQTALSLHRLRAQIDTVGCPYEFAMPRLFARLSAMGLPTMPSIADLTVGTAQQQLTEQWQQHCAESLVPITSRALKAALMAANYEGTPVLDAYLNFAAGQIKRRPNPHMALSSLMFRHQVIPESWAVERFGHDMVTRAREHWHSLSRQA